ncbi:MAG: hypothetical protein ACOX19_07575 [Fermentimonas sp.]|jgi:hypothetical protein
MKNSKKISAQAVIALKEALTNIYWRRQDIRQFIYLTIKNNLIVSTIDWDNNIKYESVSQLIDRMMARPDMYFEDLMLLLQETSNFNDFSHLKKWDDSEKKIQKAKDAVFKLRQQTKGHFDIITELKETEKRRETNIQKIRSSIAFSEKLEDLKARFLSIATNENHQARGYDLEKLLNDLFILFDLDPKSSFKITGEQIDGAFTFDNQDYLLESKWQKKQSSASDLYEFGGKISGKLKNTLGLYISLEGFSKDCLKVENQILKSMILMDGLDLMMVLDGRIKLNDLIYLKRRHASQTGEIFYRISGV